MRNRGVFVALVTPFDEAGAVDYEAFTRHVLWLSEQGIQGVVPCGTTGEASTLSPEERRHLVEICVGVARDRNIQVIVGCGSNCTDTARKHLEQAAQLGAHAALVVTPYYNRPTQAGLVAHYSALSQGSAIPIVLYNVPSRTGVCLSVETVKELLWLPNIIGIKEASGNYGYWLSLSRMIDWGERSWLAGDDDAFAVTLALGGCGIISATANIIPKSFVRMFQQFSSGQWDQAFGTQRSIHGLVRAAFIETNPAPIKNALAALGKMRDAVRLPLVRVSKESAQIIQTSLNELEAV